MDSVTNYTSHNGYTGTMYGDSHYAVFDPKGTLVFHTGKRKIETYDDMVKDVDTFPEFLTMLKNARR
ncbi:MAG: hypothetical protein J5525_12515 [Lachnospiraceae bacterium]|nr:hypothetical protein [Lachnospiraceae bacterium]